MQTPQPLMHAFLASFVAFTEMCYTVLRTMLYCKLLLKMNSNGIISLVFPMKELVGRQLVKRIYWLNKNILIDNLRDIIQIFWVSGN